MFSIEAIPCLTALPLQARLGLLFSFSAYLRFLSTASLRVETHWFPLTLGWPLPPDSLTTGSHTSNRAGLGLGWCCFLTRPPKPHTGPHKGEFGFTAFFPSLSWWKPGKQQVSVHGDLPGAQSQGEDFVGQKEKSSLPWFSLASSSHVFSTILHPVFQISQREAYSLFYAAQLLRGGHPFFLGKRKAGIACGHRIFIQLTATLGLLYLLGFML